MKITVMGREVGLTILKQREKVIVILSGGPWLAHTPGILRMAASEIMEGILAPLAAAGSSMNLYLRTPAGWYETHCEWAGLTAKTVVASRIDDASPRVRWLSEGIEQRKAYIQLKKWLGQELPKEMV